MVVISRLPWGELFSILWEQTLREKLFSSREFSVWRCRCPVYLWFPRHLVSLRCNGVSTASQTAAVEIKAHSGQICDLVRLWNGRSASNFSASASSVTLSHEALCVKPIYPLNHAAETQSALTLCNFLVYGFYYRVLCLQDPKFHASAFPDVRLSPPRY